VSRRTPILACLLTVITATAFLPAPALASRATDNVPLDAGVLVQLNQIRIAHGLTPLVASKSLGEAADRHSSDMIVKGYFSHDSSTGAPFYQRIRSYYPPSSNGSWSVGENLFWSSGTVDARGALAAWMASPEHRANILNPSWREIGIGAVSSNRAPGAYADLAVTVITTDFGTRG